MVYLKKFLEIRSENSLESARLCMYAFSKICSLSDHVETIDNGIVDASAKIVETYDALKIYIDRLSYLKLIRELNKLGFFSESDKNDEFQEYHYIRS